MAEVTDEAAKLLRALLALAVDERDERVARQPTAQKTELILDAAGLDSAEIAALTGKQAGSVRTTLSRARKSGARKKEKTDG